MGRIKHWVAVSLLALSATACGDDDDGGGGGGGSAASICMDQIACGNQLLDQASCVQLYEALLPPAKIAACDACVKKEGCDTQDTACESSCSAQ